MTKRDLSPLRLTLLLAAVLPALACLPPPERAPAGEETIGPDPECEPQGCNYLLVDASQTGSDAGQGKDLQHGAANDAGLGVDKPGGPGPNASPAGDDNELDAGEEDHAPEALTCAEYAGCLDDCWVQPPELADPCQQDCEEASSPESRAQLQAYQACAADRCSGEYGPDFFTCVDTFCGELHAACHPA